MWTRSRRCALGILVTLTAAGIVGCDGARRESRREAELSTSTIQVVESPDPTLSGRFFATAGDRDLDADLYEVTFGPLRLRQLTDGARVTTIGACPSRLVVSAAQEEVGFQDTLQEFRDSSFRSIDGLGMPKGSLPALSPDCRLLYTTVDRSTPARIKQLNLWDPQQRSASTVYEAPALGVPDWGSEGRLAVVERTPSEAGVASVTTGIVVIEPDGSNTTLPAPAPTLGTMQWGASKWMAFDEGATGTLFFDPKSGETRRLPRWLPLAWSPDGQRLLVVEAGKRRRLGLVQVADLASVREIATAKKSLFEVVWLAPDATAGGLLGPADK